MFLLQPACRKCGKGAQPAAQGTERTLLDVSSDSHCVHTEGQLHRELSALCESQGPCWDSISASLICVTAGKFY